VILELDVLSALLAGPMAPRQVGRSNEKLDREQATLLDLRMARTLFMHFSGLMRLLPRRVCVAFPGPWYSTVDKIVSSVGAPIEGWVGIPESCMYETKEKTQEGYFVRDDRSSARRNDYNNLL
jgi:hypothetical protein